MFFFNNNIFARCCFDFVRNIYIQLQKLRESVRAQNFESCPAFWQVSILSSRWQHLPPWLCVPLQVEASSVKEEVLRDHGCEWTEPGLKLYVFDSAAWRLMRTRYWRDTRSCWSLITQSTWSGNVNRRARAWTCISDCCFTRINLI